MNTHAVSFEPGLDADLPIGVLRLCAGASECPWWWFGPDDRGRLIVLGSGEGCDWQLAGAGVDDEEVEVLFTGRTLLVRSLRPGLGARLDGWTLGPGWIPVEDGSQLEIGGVSIEANIRPPEAVPAAAWGPAQPTTPAEAAQTGAFEPEVEWSLDEPLQPVAANDGWPLRGPCLFEEPRQFGPLGLRHAGYLAVLGAAYAAWVILLDRI